MFSTTSHDVLGIGNVKALFGTAPGFWNTLLGVMAQLPPSLLSNEEIMTQLALFSLPIGLLLVPFCAMVDKYVYHFIHLFFIVH